jgi:hypothetical protein
MAQQTNSKQTIKKTCSLDVMFVYEPKENISVTFSEYGK